MKKKCASGLIELENIGVTVLVIRIENLLTVQQNISINRATTVG